MNTLWGYDRLRWQTVKNRDVTAIPAFGLAYVRGTGSTTEIIVAMPGTNTAGLMVNSPTEIAASGYGMMTTDDPVWVLYDTADGRPGAGEYWGAGSSFKAKKNRRGFRVIGGATTTGMPAGSGRVLCWFDDSFTAPTKGCQVRDTTSQTCIAGATTTMSWNTEVYDDGAATEGYHSLVTNPSRLTIAAGSATFTADAGTDVLTHAATVNLHNGGIVTLTTTGTLPAGLALATDYYVIRITATTIKLASSWADALAGTAIDVTDAGAGVHTLTSSTDLVPSTISAALIITVTAVGPPTICQMKGQLLKNGLIVNGPLTFRETKQCVGGAVVSESIYCSPSYAEAAPVNGDYYEVQLLNTSGGDTWTLQDSSYFQLLRADSSSNPNSVTIGGGQAILRGQAMGP